jgi:hypothetical protein
LGGKVLLLAQVRAHLFEFWRHIRQRACPAHSLFGLRLDVKSSKLGIGPGPNFFSDRSENVWIDNHGFLHLRISYRAGKWWSAEVVCDCSPGFGTYAVRVPAGTIRDFDANAVLGLFNWSDDAAFAHREIDFEFSTWGEKENATGNSQFVVQPYDQPGHTNRFFLRPAVAPALLSYSWMPRRVLFTAVSGSGERLRSFEYRGAIPDGGNPRINLWLLRGQAPQSARDIEVVVEAFTFEKP